MTSVVGCWWYTGSDFCRTLPIVRAQVICLHEHVYETNLCQKHLDQHDGDQTGWCHQCWRLDGHRCPVSARVVENEVGNASGAPVATARRTPHPAGPRRPSSLYGDDAKDGTHG